MNTYGEYLKVTIFGESHGAGIGVVIDGLPAGEAIDLEAVRVQMARRAPGGSELATQRRETDEPEILSGLYSPPSCETATRARRTIIPRSPAPATRTIPPRCASAATWICAAAARSAGA